MAKIQKLKVNGGWWHFKDVLMDTPESFTTPTGNLWGTPRNPDFLTDPGFRGAVAGQLPYFYRDSFWRCVYAVYSYSTPIAWLTSDGVWIAPAVKYSVSTSRHQGRIFTAISEINRARKAAHGA